MLINGQDNSFVQVATRLGIQLDLKGEELVFKSKDACIEHHSRLPKCSQNSSCYSESGYMAGDEGEKWLETIYEAAEKQADGSQLRDVFLELWRLVVFEEWLGACHDTSAAMFMVLSELGFSPELIIGVVHSPAGSFDHSWCEVGGEIFDVAVGYPSEEGRDVGPPVFASLDVVTGERTVLDYTNPHNLELDEVAQKVAASNLETYANSCSPKGGLWDVTEELAYASGLDKSASYFRGEYGSVMRTRRD